MDQKSFAPGSRPALPSSRGSASSLGTRMGSESRTCLGPPSTSGFKNKGSLTRPRRLRPRNPFSSHTFVSDCSSSQQSSDESEKGSQRFSGDNFRQIQQSLFIFAGTSFLILRYIFSCCLFCMQTFLILSLPYVKIVEGVDISGLARIGVVFLVFAANLVSDGLQTMERKIYFLRTKLPWATQFFRKLSYLNIVYLSSFELRDKLPFIHALHAGQTTGEVGLCFLLLAVFGSLLIWIIRGVLYIRYKRRR